jgi:hypothetical protein
LASLGSLRWDGTSALTVKLAASAVTVSVVDREEPPNVAVIVTVVVAETAVVSIPNVELVAPETRVTDAGTAAAALSLDSAIETALVGALLKVTAP